MSQLELGFNQPLEEIEKKRLEAFGEEWFSILRDVIKKKEVQSASAYVGKRRAETVVYPAREDTFKAFKLTPYKKVKLVIIGQNPYHNGTASGISFSSNSNVIPDSLKVIFNAILESTGEFCLAPDLTPWAEQGVFLINTSLTVEQGDPNSHLNIGWEHLTSFAIRKLSDKPEPVVYFLWGAEAKRMKQFIVNPTQLIIECEHPAASLHNKRPWVYNDCFNQCNEYLKKQGAEPIAWNSVNVNPPF